ncbi:MAG TPA: C25 family cysteine peptidase, partial [Syntrophorhabdales bacterium]|nr:C25 family cysteine peptidase [Syntrophorhabdales bacterium]
LFQDVYTESLAEALILAPQGGAVAVFASSGLTDPGPQSVMNQELIRVLFSGVHATIGQAVVRAKTATTDPDVRKTWNLIGDPAMRVK